MSVTIRSHWQFITNRTDDLFAYGDKLMQALLDQEVCVPGFRDSSVAADVERGLIEIEANTSGSTLADAVAANRACVRAVLHGVGIGTPDWPTHDEAMSMILAGLQTEALADA